MKTKRNAVATAVILGCGALSAQADNKLSEYFTFSGFGTFAGVQTNSNEGLYVRETQPAGANKTASMMVDSNLGLQVTAKATDWLSATVQTLTAQRSTPELSTKIEWAFVKVKVKPIDGLTVRGGKFSLPNFLVSDSRRVGYANNTLRPSNEVYGLDLMNGGLTGADVSYRLPIAGRALTITGLGGKSSSVSRGGSSIDFKDVLGANLLWDGDWYTVRVGQVKGKPQLPESVRPASLGPLTYIFTGYGFTMDRANVVLQGEFVTRRADPASPFIDADGSYLMGGYRIGKFLPYAQIAKRKPVSGGSVAPQKSTSLGVRWDAFSSAAIKFQAERIDTDGSAGASFVTAQLPGFGPPRYAPITKPVNTLSVSLDFVF